MLLLIILISLAVAAPILSKDKDKDKGPAAGAPPKSLTPEQDPWVQQAVEILKSGKKGQIAAKATTLKL